MKRTGKYLFAVAGVAAAVCIWAPVSAQPLKRRQPVFACSLGRKSVSVTRLGEKLTYTFGTSNHTEISITGSALQGNLYHWSGLYAGPEQQLRFVNGQYSYIVYNMAGNSNTDTMAISGLSVIKGDNLILDVSCKHYASFGGGIDVMRLPEDADRYSAM